MTDRQPTAAGTMFTDRFLDLVGTGGVLVVFLLQVRRWEAGFAWQPGRPWAHTRIVLALGYYDLVFLTAVGAAFTAAFALARQRPRLQRTLRLLFAAVAVLSVIMAYVNEKALKELGSPLTYQWLYYSDFLRSLDAYNALQALVTWAWLEHVLVRCLWLLALSFLAARALRWAARRTSPGAIGTAAAASFGLALGVGRAGLPETHSDARKLQNPIVALITSALQTDEHPLLTKMPTSVAPTDFLPYGARPAAEVAAGIATRERARRAGIHNVLIIVLESVAAEYVGAYGAPYGATTRLDAYRPQALAFTRIYAHVPTTIHSLVTLLLSVYHPHSPWVLTKEYPHVRLPSLSSELRMRGYRTAFFTAADNRFQRQDVFSQTHGFGELYDYRTFGCAARVFRARPNDGPYLDGVADQCAASRVAEWAAEPGAAPFLSVFWTMQTHYPYFLTQAPASFGVADSTMTRYLNALHETDEAVGSLLATLEERGVLESTLVVVIGDHGEAFGQHGHYVHGIDLYEEEVHVPLLLINRRLFHGETDSTVGGLIDIAPTIMDILGAPVPGAWQGRSLFDADRSGRAYLFTSRSRVLFGYREGQRKFIFDASTGAAELYDLGTDPVESMNIAAGAREFTRQAEQRLATWVQFQRRYFENVLVPAAR